MNLDKCLNHSDCKDYLDKKVSEDKINKIIASATKAYSPGSLQAWEFIVVRDESKKEEIAKASKNQLWINQAPVLIVVCGNENRVKQFFPDKGDIYSKQAVGAAAQVMLLKAEELGLGSCWVSGFSNEKICRLLDIPPGVVPCAIITLGHADHKSKEPVEINPNNLIHYNKYGKSTSKPPFNLSNSTKNIEKSFKKATSKIKKILK